MDIIKTDRESSKRIFSASDFQYLWLYPIIMQINFTLIFNGFVALTVMAAIHIRMAFCSRQKKFAPMPIFLKYSINAITVFGYALCIAGIIMPPLEWRDLVFCSVSTIAFFFFRCRLRIQKNRRLVAIH